ncbi:MAG: thiamine phosphate synthase [Terracidiphilus sp.]
MVFRYPRVYPILDASILPLTGRPQFLGKLGNALTKAGVRLLEFRNKISSTADLMKEAAALREAMPRDKVKLILDDREDLVLDVGFDGVHLDSGDVAASEARWLLGPERIIGAFGGSEAILPEVFTEPANYFAIGPVFETRTKQTTKKPIGVEGVRKLREEAGFGVVLSAAGGITFETAQAVLDAGVNMVAVSEAIFHTSDPAAEFRRWKDQFG